MLVILILTWVFIFVYLTGSGSRLLDIWTTEGEWKSRWLQLPEGSLTRNLEWCTKLSTHYMYFFVGVLEPHRFQRGRHVFRAYCNFWLRQELKMSQCPSVCLAQVCLQQSIFIFLGQRTIRALKSESYSRSLKYCVLF